SSANDTLPPPPDLRLSPRVHDILSHIDDTALRPQIDATVRYALAALADLSRIHLPQDDFEEGDTGSNAGGKHLELAPYVLASVGSVNRLLAHLMQTFPAPAEPTASPSDDSFDLEFDLVDGPTGEGKALMGGAQQKAALSPAEGVADAAHAFGSMLRSRVLGLADRLRHAVGQADSWPLLAELDDGKHKLTKAVQGVLFGILGVFAQDARREEILPEYRSAVTESVQLRSALSELSYHVNRFNAAIAKATAGETVPLVVALADRLARFSTRPEYRTLRSEDKKAVIDFRRSLFELRHRKEGIPMGPLRLAVEGFSKFLESMHAINHREVLVLHDHQRLQEALDRLERATDLTDEGAACAELDAVVVALGAVQGRHPDLDDARRNYIPVDAEALAGSLIRWRALAESALSTVG
ncbi:MAG TPA: hypothetical protein VFH51_12535, partial [Myxococcota bacterium]|nr:hypothetical protein [Myxococcota bacterium]